MTRHVLISAVLLMTAQAARTQQPNVVRVKPGFATVIVCPAQPELVTVGSPEQFSAQSAGNFVLVKPLVSQGSTNMFIKAGFDSYNLVLQVSDTPDLEVRLQPAMRAPATAPSPAPKNGAASAPPEPAASRTSSLKAGLEGLSPKTRTILSNYLRTPRPYTYSVVNSDVTFAVDHMTMIENRLHVICTLLNNSKIAYDVGYVRFRLLEHTSSYIVFRKKIKEEELEPVQEFYNPRVMPNSAARLLFVFDKHGFSDRSALEIKCTEESGRRDLTLAVPGTFIQ